MDIAYALVLPPFDDALLDGLHELSLAVFGESDVARIRWRLSQMPDPSVFTAHEGARLVGFKAGYALSERKYYSWLGGVAPDRRRGGIASRLMARQHDWLTARGYALVETAANQANTAMAAVNLEHGFLVAGTRRNPDNTQILFLKELADPREASESGPR